MSMSAAPRFLEMLKKKTFSSGSAASFESTDSLDSVSSSSSSSPSKTPVAVHLSNHHILIKGHRLHPGMSAQYKIMEKLGEGGFGVVYRALRQSTRQQVAIKVIYKDRLTGSRLIQCSELGQIPVEVYILRRLNHPSIIRLIDLYQDDHFYYMITELAGANWRSDKTSAAAPRDLFEAIDSRSGLTEEQARHVFKQVISAVAYLQLQYSLVHRDIKDENICVDADLNIKLIDFGSVARFAASSKDEKDYFQKFYGTVSYSAPEQVRGEKYRGPEAEMWSLGCLLYTCLKNQNPFDNTQATLTHDPVPNVKDICSTECSHLIRWLLAKNPAERATIQDVLAHPWLKASST